MVASKNLMAYQKGHKLSKDVQLICRAFPPEENNRLPDQVRRSSNSVFVNLTEAFRRRRNMFHIISKLIDIEGKNSKTSVWLGFALNIQYSSKDMFYV